jgi:hypothetical protein
MSDVTAVVLSMGEPYIARALASVAAQSEPPHEVVVVEQVAPFHRALAEAARRTTTPFFVQVDADMILDRDCLASLRAAVDERTGVVCGRLRDPLMGDVVGVKLFRTECVRTIGTRDSVAQDNDFMRAMQRAGWRLHYLEDADRGTGREADRTADPAARTFGEHHPDYTPAYTIRKYLYEGRRYRYRGVRGALKAKIARLEQSRHALAPLAQLALAHGVFLTTVRDELRPAPPDPRAAWLMELLDARTGRVALERLLPLARHRRLGEVFRRFVAAGRAIADAGAGATLDDVMATLREGRTDGRALVARLALGHGLLARDSDTGSWSGDFDRDERALKSFLQLGTGDQATLAQRIRARSALWMKQLRGARQSRW